MVENVRDTPSSFVGGKDMTEREIFLQMIDHLQRLHTLARGMAQSRKDIRWLAIAGIYEESLNNVKKLMIAPSVARTLILPGRFGGR